MRWRGFETDRAMVKARSPVGRGMRADYRTNRQLADALPQWRNFAKAKTNQRYPNGQKNQNAGARDPQRVQGLIRPSSPLARSARDCPVVGPPSTSYAVASLIAPWVPICNGRSGLFPVSTYWVRKTPKQI